MYDDGKHKRQSEASVSSTTNSMHIETFHRAFVIHAKFLLRSLPLDPIDSQIDD